MLYFQSILKAKCCGNYICLFCTKEYLQTKHIYERNENMPPNFLEDLKSNILLNEISCPHCFTHGFHINTVTPAEQVRDYSMRVPSGASSYYASQASPIRIGESFEELKRKVIPYKVLSQKSDNPHPTTTSPSLNPIPGSSSSSANNSPSLRLALPLEDLYSNHPSSRSRPGSSRVAGIAMEGTGGNESPLLSPQSTYRSRENSPTHHTHPVQTELELSSVETLPAPTNLFARTMPIRDATENDANGPVLGSWRRSTPSHPSQQVLSQSMDEVSESVEALDDSLAGMRILARHETFERDFATDMVRGVFHSAFNLRQVPIHQQ